MKLTRMFTCAHLPAVLIFFSLLCCAASALGAGKEAPPPTSGYEQYLKDASLIAQIDTNYLYSTSDTSSSFSGGGIAALIAPRYRITDKTLFIFLYDGSYSKDRDYDNLGSIPVTHMYHNFTPMLKIKMGDTNFTVKIVDAGDYVPHYLIEIRYENPIKAPPVAGTNHSRSN